MAKASKLDATVTLRLEDMPEVLANLRREMAMLLRAEADAQPDDVVGWATARSLRAVADAFEAGLTHG